MKVKHLNLFISFFVLFIFSPLSVFALQSSGKVDDIIYISSVTKALQTDGNIVSVKDMVAERTVNYITKYNVDGIEDISFKNNIGEGFDGNVFSIAVNADNKIVVGGDFDNFNGVTHKGLVMLKEDGREESDFNKNLGSGFDSYIIAVETQSNGKILVLGTFSSFNSKERKGMIRLNADGTEDITFYENLSRNLNDIDNFGHAAYTMYTQEDNKILLGIYISSDENVIHSKTIMLNSDGTRDTTFSDEVSDIFDFNE